VYAGKVVNITKFGAFVNVLPGRDGLLHISKLSSLAGGARINNVEDVLTLGQPVEVRVDDIDPQGKVSLSLAGAPETSGGGGGGRDRDRDRGGRDGGGGRDRDRDRGGRDSGAPRREQSAGSSHASDSGSSDSAPATSNGDAGTPSFEDAFEAELVADLGDLGPGAVEGESRGGGNRPPRNRSRRR
jgi:polyribonucleotide nucleotidyltransferase